MLKRRLYRYLISIHFLVIILHNIISTADGYQAVYGKAGQKGLPSYLASLQNIVHTSPINEYARFSGTETGFGFFAPQVGSQYISQFSIFTAQDVLLDKTISPLKQKESLLRYSTFLDIFQEDDSLSVRYSRALVNSMAKQILAQNKEASYVDAQVYRYSYPSLKDYQNHEHIHYIRIHQKIIE